MTSELILSLIFHLRSLCAMLAAAQFYRLDGCFGFNGPLRQYFSLYRAVSQREGDREGKG